MENDAIELEFRTTWLWRLSSSDSSLDLSANENSDSQDDVEETLTSPQHELQ